MFVSLMMLGPSPQNRASTALNALLAPDAANPAAYRGIFPEIRQASLVRNVIHDAALRARALTTALIRGYIPVFLPSRNSWRAKASSIDSGFATIFAVQHSKKSNEELLSNLIPITAAHGMACSHRPFDFVWRFTVWTRCALRHFVRFFGRAVDLDA